MAVVTEQFAKEGSSGQRIAMRPVPVGERNFERAAELTEAIRRQTRKNFATQAHRAERPPVKIEVEPVEFFLQKVKIETHVMCHKNGSVGDVLHVMCHFIESRSLRHHRIGDAGEAHDKWGNWVARIEQCLIGIDHFMPIEADERDFGHAGWAFYSAGRLDVNNTIHRGKIDCLVSRPKLKGR